MKLTLKIEQEVQVQDVLNLIWGTGALRYEWWHEAQVWRSVGFSHELVTEGDERPDDMIRIGWYAEEGSSAVTWKMVTMQQIVDAAALTIKRGMCCTDDMISEGLGFACAEDADDVLQRAVFDGEAIFG